MTLTLDDEETTLRVTTHNGIERIVLTRGAYVETITWKGSAERLAYILGGIVQDVADN